MNDTTIDSGRRAGRSVLITGASTGIGEATALALARAGWHVLAGVRDPDTAPQLRQRGAADGWITPMRLDVTDHDSLATALAEVGQRVPGGRLDALVNNAGIGDLAPTQTVSPQTLRAIFEVNVVGVVAVTQAALPLMGSGGRLVFVGSVGDRITMPFGGPLTSSKWAIASLAEALRLELACEGIAVSIVEPGSIRTPAVDKVERAARRTGDALRLEHPELARRFAAGVARAVAHERGGSSPTVVAGTIHRALASARPRSRYLTGRHARLLAALGRLPDPLFDRIRLRLFDQPTDAFGDRRHAEDLRNGGRDRAGEPA